MTQVERKALETMLHNARTPSVDFTNIDKLESEDFKLGWKLAMQRIQETLDFLLDPTSKPADVKRYANGPRN